MALGPLLAILCQTHDTQNTCLILALGFIKTADVFYRNKWLHMNVAQGRINLKIMGASTYQIKLNYQILVLVPLESI